MTVAKTRIFAEQALLPSGWHEAVRIEIVNARILSVTPGATADSQDERHRVVVPGMPNLHSHAFQRGMAGLTEIRGTTSDDFWSWRDVMYRFALSMDPDQAEAIAAQLYVEMLEAGFTRVGEFHYLHHDSDGRPYANVAEMADRIVSAARQAGIGLTLLPVFYAHSNFGGAAPRNEQRRFINDLNRFADLVQGCRQSVKALNQAAVGIAPHSLRAVTADELQILHEMAGDEPIHIHIAEQTKEVEDCLAWCGQRPIDWLLANAPVDGRWCLVHATQATDAEIAAMARTGAVAGLCPVTEANLGDGTFRAVEHLAQHGKIGIGSDSNVLIGVADELRQLEYSQRLQRRSRNVVAAPAGSTGRMLYDLCAAGGTQALGASPALVAAGATADLVSLDLSYPGMEDAARDAVLDAWIFTGKVKSDCVWVGGIKMVEGGRHRERDDVARRFRTAMKQLAR